MTELTAVEAIRGLVASYALACDLRDRDLLTSLFVPGARLTIHAAESPDVVLTAPDDIATIPGLLTKYDLTYHDIGTHRIVLDPDGTQGRGDTYCTAHHLNGPSDRVMVIHYVDRYQRHGSSWLFAQRDLNLRFTEYHVALGPMPPTSLGPGT